jgi:uncharacterized protein YjiK
MFAFPGSSRLLSALSLSFIVACGNGSASQLDAFPSLDSRDARDVAESSPDQAVVVVDAAEPDEAAVAADAGADTARDVAAMPDLARDGSSTQSEARPGDADVGRPDVAPAVDASVDSPLRDTGAAEVPRDASSTKPITLATWPGGNTVANASAKNAFGTNLSGLLYQPAAAEASAILWAVQNSPSKVFRLTWNGAAFVPVTTEGWSDGKTLAYPTGSGSPDSEGLTRTEWDQRELYVASEENNEVSSTSRLSILRYDLGGTATTMVATHEWNLTTDLPSTDANKGLEAIAWIPDTFLVERGFYDENAKAAYDPASYANHGRGIFLVGMESTGMVYGYALDHTAKTFKRVATFTSGQAGIMDLAFDRDTGTLWALCDSVCNNRMTLLDIDTAEGSTTQGRFILRATVPPPTTLTSTNNEGISMAPELECANNRKGFFWADDDESNGYTIRRDSIPCGRLF